MVENLTFKPPFPFLIYDKNPGCEDTMMILISQSFEEMIKAHLKYRGDILLSHEIPASLLALALNDMRHEYGSSTYTHEYFSTIQRIYDDGMWQGQRNKHIVCFIQIQMVYALWKNAVIWLTEDGCLALHGAEYAAMLINFHWISQHGLITMEVNKKGTFTKIFSLSELLNLEGHGILLPTPNRPSLVPENASCTDIDDTELSAPEIDENASCTDIDDTGLSAPEIDETSCTDIDDTEPCALGMDENAGCTKLSAPEIDETSCTDIDDTELSAPEIDENASCTDIDDTEPCALGMDENAGCTKLSAPEIDENASCTDIDDTEPCALGMDESYISIDRGMAFSGMNWLD